MKNYLSTKRGNSRRLSLPKQARNILLCIIAAVVLWFVVPRLVTGVVAIVMSPVDAVRSWVLESSDSLPQYLRDRHSLIAEITDLKQSLATTGGTENTLTRLTTENEQFRLLCDAVPDERVIARVVGRPPQLPYDVVMLDRGQDHGVVESAPVFVGRDQIIGYVSRVYKSSSLVTLISTANMRSMAYIIGPNIYTYAVGQGGGIVRVEVPQGVPLSVGDVVVLPAIDAGVYGRVAEVVTSPTQPEQYGYVPMESNLQSVQYVSIGREAIVPHSYEEAESLVRDIKAELFMVELPPGVLVTPAGTSTATSTATTTTSTSTGQ